MSKNEEQEKMLGKLQFKSKEERQAENFRRMFIAMANIAQKVNFEISARVGTNVILLTGLEYFFVPTYRDYLLAFLVVTITTPSLPFSPNC